jgi:hypothetical protein
MTRITLAFVIFLAVYTPSPAQVEPYFPDGAFDDEDKERDDDTRQTYAEYLREMGEPSLWKLSKDNHAVSVYRLLWFEPFDNVFSVRIVKSGKSMMLYLVKLDVPDHRKPGKVSLKQARKLTEDEWTMLQVHLERSRFWKMKTSIKINFGDGGVITDGDGVLCEGAANGKYHIVERLDVDHDFEKLCRFTLGLSGREEVKKNWAKYHGEEKE